MRVFDLFTIALDLIFLQDVCLRQEDCKPVNKHVDRVLSYISYIGIVVSIIGLVLTIATLLAIK